MKKTSAVRSTSPSPETTTDPLAPQHHGMWLRDLRLAAGLNQTELAERMDVPAAGVCRNEKLPDLSTPYIKKVLRALNMQLRLVAEPMPAASEKSSA